MENATIAITMAIGKMNARKTKFEGKCYKCKKYGHKSSERKTKIENTWCRCHYYGEFGHIVMNCVEHYMRKRDSTKRCFICIELGHLAKNCMNTDRIKDEKKENFDNKRK